MKFTILIEKTTQRKVIVDTPQHRGVSLKDIGLGGPSIWAVAEDGGIYRWGAEVNDWELTNGQGSWAIAVDQHGHAWVVEAGTGRLLRGVGQ
ncbi:MAG: hypothetical protein QF689_00285 [Candidatus Latescibacteria bacterium]|nr:hypothetical protein [Candidatus Latescibacterota bacterium]